MAGLLIGKPLGVFLFSWISVKLGWCALPSQSNWKHLFGLGILAGIGFTMSIFIALLSFDKPAFQTEAKFAVLVASLMAGLIGYQFLKVINKKIKA